MTPNDIYDDRVSQSTQPFVEEGDIKNDGNSDENEENTVIRIIIDCDVRMLFVE